MTNTIRIATRASILATWQANYIKKLLLQLQPSLEIELIEVSTAGDRDKQTELAKIGGKTLFVKELQQQLLDNKADIAVHCIKDMSVHDHSDLTIAAILKRGDPYDVFSSHQTTHLEMLPRGSVIGTSSPRRKALLNHLFPEYEVKPLRGNLDTRLKKLDDGEYDAIILAAAGLKRLGMTDRVNSHLHKETFVPAIGQGALGIECLKTRTDLIDLVSPLHHVKTATCVAAERAVNRVLNGNCFSPIGAYAGYIDGQLDLNAFVASLNGEKLIRSSLRGSIEEPENLGKKVADDLIRQGALELLNV